MRNVGLIFEKMPIDRAVSVIFRLIYSYQLPILVLIEPMTVELEAHVS